MVFIEMIYAPILALDGRLWMRWLVVEDKMNGMVGGGLDWCMMLILNAQPHRMVTLCI